MPADWTKNTELDNILFYLTQATVLLLALAAPPLCVCAPWFCTRTCLAGCDFEDKLVTLATFDLFDPFTCQHHLFFQVGCHGSRFLSGGRSNSADRFRRWEGARIAASGEIAGVKNLCSGVETPVARPGVTVDTCTQVWRHLQPGQVFRYLCPGVETPAARPGVRYLCPGVETPAARPGVTVDTCAKVWRHLQPDQVFRYLCPDVVTPAARPGVTVDTCAKVWRHLQVNLCLGVETPAARPGV
ncbi:hypothetical protein Bbelb_208620 [Branchiostoma belcheri]|nr:hypothetical protein Bbelb_208620 [Branchiostoma belcheri]